MKLSHLNPLKVIAVMQVIRQFSNLALQSYRSTKHVSVGFITFNVHFFLEMCFTSYCYERGSLAMAERQDPIIRTQFSWLAGNLPLGEEV